MRFIITTLSILMLWGCGFTPLYSIDRTTQTTPSVIAQFNKIDIALIPNREGQFLRNALIDALYIDGYPAQPAYTLSIAPIQESISDFDITIDSEATRKQLRLKTSMKLIDNTTNKVLLNRSLTAITSHNVLTSEFSTLVTEQSAREATLNDLARQIKQQLALFL